MRHYIVMPLLFLLAALGAARAAAEAASEPEPEQVQGDCDSAEYFEHPHESTCRSTFSSGAILLNLGIILGRRHIAKNTDFPVIHVSRLRRHSSTVDW
jgi:hypothetical protein